MNINLANASFKDFENPRGLDIFQRAAEHERYLSYLKENEFMNYRLTVTSGYGPVIELAEEGHIKKGEYVSFVCNDYLGFTQHPEIKRAAIAGIEKYGTGAGSSPLIGGVFPIS